MRRLAQLGRTMEQPVQAWDVLATLAPPGPSASRPPLARSCGDLQDRLDVGLFPRLWRLRMAL